AFGVAGKEMDSANKFDIVVVGCGVAGISTVHHLITEKEYKGKIAILEARSRTGGRIEGMTIDGNHVELGANWIHGLINNPIYSLATKYKLVDPLQPGLTLKPSKEYHICGVLSNGEVVPLTTIDNIYKTYFCILKKAENYYKKFLDGDEVNVVDFQDSVGCFIEKEVENYLKINCPNGSSTERAIFDQLIKRETCIAGCHSMNEVSLKYFGAYEELPGGNLTIPGGYSQILLCLLNTVKNKLKEENREDHLNILLKHEVQKIKWSGVGKKGAELVEITCSNGAVFKCNHVVVTIPLGVLKNNVQTLFEPKLPQYKLDCIQSMGFGVVNKIYLEYKTRLCPYFWASDLDELFCFWSGVGDEWFTKIYSFTKVTDRCIIGWVSGKEAETVENLNGVDISNCLTKWLRVFTNKPDFPEPENIYVTKWGSDKFSMGSYSYISTKSTVRDIELLSQPIYSDPGEDKPQIVFAGEACHPSFFSTVHGAYISGRKAAFYLLDIENEKDTKSSLK
ncbi:peroxisomal N(1)-acetyl-spermine/spermidine oxidase-like protein 1, partial [Leptotrombidium deliense]